MNGWPYITHIDETWFYCMINLAYHIYSTIKVLRNPQNDFFEMLLHHLMTIILISASYLGCYGNNDVVYMLIIDHCDIWIGLIRAVMDVTSDLVNLVIYTILMSTWLYSRFYLMWKEVLWGGLITPYLDGTTADMDNQIQHVFMIVFIAVLLLMNVYWFVLLIRMGVRTAVGKKRPTDL